MFGMGVHAVIQMTQQWSDDVKKGVKTICTQKKGSQPDWSKLAITEYKDHTMSYQILHFGWFCCKLLPTFNGVCQI